MNDDTEGFMGALRRRWVELIVSLVIGLAGALLFVYLSLPLPWLIGPVFTTTIAAMNGVRIWMPNQFRLPMFIVLGASFGLTVSAELGDQVWRWFPSIALVAVYVTFAVGAATAYLYWIGRFDPVTAYFSATPGGLVAMLAMGESYGGDIRTMTLIQSTRLVMTILTIPLAFRVFGGYAPPDTLWAASVPFTASGGELALLAVIAVAGYFIGHLLKFPAAHLLGSMFSVAVFKYFGVIDTFIPPVLTSIALLFIGTGIGGSFNGVRVKTVVTTLLHGLGVGAIMLSLALGFALVSESVSGGSVKALILAFSPGGFAEMALVASGLGIEVTFVIVHQLARYLMLLALAPAAVFFIRRKWPSND